MKLGIHGYRGRMGNALLAAAEKQGLTVVGRVDQGDPLSPALDACDVLLDFSYHSATPDLVHWAALHGKPVVIGTTGHNDQESAAIRACGGDIPMVWAGNYSVGVNVLLFLAEQAAQVLGPDFDPEIIEAHHRLKADAPSGTARNLVDAVLQGLGWGPNTVVHGREGITGERPARQLGVHAVRGGGIIGEHTVLFAGTAETLELTHRAADRAIFAEGALRAAAWILRQAAPGVYDMRDVLGLKPS